MCVAARGWLPCCEAVRACCGREAGLHATWQSRSQCPCCRSKKQSAEDDDSGRNVEPIMRHCLTRWTLLSRHAAKAPQAKRDSEPELCDAICPGMSRAHQGTANTQVVKNAEPPMLFSGISILWGAEWSLAQGAGEHVFFLASDCMASFVDPTSPAASTVTNPSSCAAQVSGGCGSNVLPVTL